MFQIMVRDVMTTPAIHVAPDTPLKQVARTLVEHAISGVPVVDADGRVAGVISEIDLLVKEGGPELIHHRPLWHLFGESKETRAEQAKLDATTAGQAMAAPAVVIGPDASIHEAAQRMVERHINRLPVVDAGGHLVGIVTRADIVRTLVRSDADLARIIREEVILKTLWIDPASLMLQVTDGVVQVRGTVDRRSTAEFLERCLRQVDGVVGVEAEVGWELDDRTIEAPDKDLVWPEHHA